jgi:hypothetical protein
VRDRAQKISTQELLAPRWSYSLPRREGVQSVVRYAAPSDATIPEHKDRCLLPALHRKRR